MALADIKKLASRFYAAIETVRGSLDSDFRAALFAADGQESGAWGLSLVLATWRRQKAGDSAPELADTGVGPLVAQIQRFESSFPGAFSKFLDTAESAADVGRIAAAGSYFSSTISGLGMLERPGLLAWLNSDAFKKVAKALRERAGGPVNALAQPSALPVKPTPPNFDRADFRPKAPVATPAAPPRVAEPANSQRDLDLARLVQSGWSPEEAARILEGPAALKARSDQTRAPATAIDGKEILKRAKPSDEPSRSSDGDAVAGAVKSGIDLLREILKQVNTGDSKSPNKGSGSSAEPPSGNGGGRGSMGGPGPDYTGDYDGPGRMDGGGDGIDAGSSDGGDGGSIFINDSSDVDD